jgi:hypothetical protein
VHWVGQIFKGCTLPCGKKGLKAQGVKVVGKRQEPKSENLEMLCLGIPEKAIKSFSTRNKGPHKNNKTRPS